MTKFKLGLIVGSNRRESINRKLAQALIKLGATFKPELVDGNDTITDESTRTFLKNLLDQLAALTAKLTAKIAPRAAA